MSPLASHALLWGLVLIGGAAACLLGRWLDRLAEPGEVDRRPITRPAALDHADDVQRWAEGVRR